MEIGEWQGRSVVVEAAMVGSDYGGYVASEHDSDTMLFGRKRKEEKC